ncbi:MAG: Zinc finger, CDGSH-type [Gemmatimonadetes bacterium]|nr:Zinc finger, CDGSH-type [Gemmatimonadota bacterium]
MENENAGVTITVRNNGPYAVEGPIRLVDADGNEYPVVAGKRVSLCRCGASTNKPFCDGTHSKMGFDAAERAVREAEGGAAGA